jgi:tetratricopeptide (TPR) repeat protein
MNLLPPRVGHRRGRTAVCAAFRLASLLALSASLDGSEVPSSGPRPHPAASSPGQANTAAASTTNGVPSEGILDVLRSTDGYLASTNLVSPVPRGGPPALRWLEQQLEIARQQRRLRQNQPATQGFIAVLNAPTATEAMRQVALLELGLMAQEENDLPKAQQIFAQYHSRWPEDVTIPEILLRQGLIYRRMGVYQSALSKFYAVMTSALVLKTTQMDYYQRLVLQAQTEIADTHYQMGQHREAVDFLSRLLKMNEQALNRPQLHYKLIRSLASLGRSDQVAAQAADFLMRFPNASEQAEVRFHCATALRQLGRPSEALQQVFSLLSEQRAAAEGNPETWIYWQQRLGNEIGNQLYREGDYGKALDVYVRLAQLDASPAWQLPVWYQMGMSYERLEQPAKAIETYRQILTREKELGTNVTPSLRAVLEMARWRQNYLNWQGKAEAANRQVRGSPSVLGETNPAPEVHVSALPAPLTDSDAVPLAPASHAQAASGLTGGEPTPPREGSAGPSPLAPAASRPPTSPSIGLATNPIIVPMTNVVVTQLPAPPPVVLADPNAPLDPAGLSSGTAAPMLSVPFVTAINTPGGAFAPPATNQVVLPPFAPAPERARPAPFARPARFSPVPSRFPDGARDGFGPGLE